MELDQLVNQGQADARPLLRAAPRVLDAVEPLEDMWDLLGRNADSRVADLQLHGALRGRDDDGDLTLEGVLECVGREG